MTKYSEFQTRLVSLADDEYREFSMRGIPSDRPFIGVRIPDIRKLVSKISPEDFDTFIDVTPVAIEEVLARGLVIARLPYEKMLEVFDSQVKYLDNWCTVDIFISALRKTVRHHEADFLDKKVEPLLKSQDEFAVRAGLVSLLDFYVKEDYLHLIFDRIESLTYRKEYYIKMAIAWLLAECFIKFPEETLSYMNHSSLEKWTFNKTISKICDSYRVEDDMKSYLKSLRKKE